MDWKSLRIAIDKEIKKQFVPALRLKGDLKAPIRTL